MADNQQVVHAPTADELIAAAATKPGVADLMAMYQQQAKVVAAANQYMVRPRPTGVVSSGTATPGILT